MMTPEDRKIYQEFGQFIRAARRSKKLTQDDVAKLIGITASFYNYLENGKRKITLPMAMSICKALDLDLNDFLISRKRKKPQLIAR